MVQTTAKGYPHPETSDSPHGPDQLADLAVRADELTDAARMTTTERDALAAPDLYDGRVVMIVDSAGVWQRIEVYHADDPADPDLGGTWHIIVDRALADGRYANLIGDTFTGLVAIDGSGVHPTLGDDFALAGDSPSVYPTGYTTFRDAQGSFPAGTNGIVETINPVGTANVRQLNWIGANGRVYTRVATDSTAWEPWIELTVPDAAKINLTSNQSISSTTNTIIPFNNTVFNQGGISEAANDRMVLTRGLWVVTLSTAWEGYSGGSEYRSARILLNSSRVSHDTSHVSGTSILRTHAATLIEAADGDILEGEVRHGADQAINLLGEPDGTYMTAAKVGHI